MVRPRASRSGEVTLYGVPGWDIPTCCRVLANIRQGHIAKHPALLPRCVVQGPEPEYIDSGFEIAQYKRLGIYTDQAWWFQTSKEVVPNGGLSSCQRRRRHSKPGTSKLHPAAGKDLGSSSWIYHHLWHLDTSFGFVLLSGIFDLTTNTLTWSFIYISRSH